MVWNDELETLVERARETSGGDAIAKAYIRAINAAPALPEGAVDLDGWLPRKPAVTTKWVGPTNYCLPQGRTEAYADAAMKEAATMMRVCARD